MSYKALARKYRPETFDQVVGQGHVTTTLRAALRKDKLSHAYLFSGPRGCGKTTVARLLAKGINCMDVADGDPCGCCATCLAIARGNYLDVLEIDAASNTGVDNIRELRDMAQYSPSEGSSRVFIIDEVHMLSKGAFNALLKILEEPPARVYFFFATTEPNKIPRTILSRCQRFDFRLLCREELAGRLTEVAVAEGVEVDEAGLSLLVSLAEGSMRDGLSLLDQVMAGCEERIDENRVVEAFGLVRSEFFLKLNAAIVDGDAAGALRLVDELAGSGQSLDAFARGIVFNFRNLMLLKIDPDLAPMVELAPDQVEVLKQQAGHFSEQDLLALIERSGRHFEQIHRSTQPRILLEAAVVEYCRFESRVLLADLARRLEALGGGDTGPSGGGDSSRPAAAQKRTITPKPDSSSASGATPSTQAVSAGAGATVPNWTLVIEQLMQKSPRVASCLLEGLPSLDKDAGLLTVAFAQDKSFQASSINAERKLIETVVTGLLGKPTRLEIQIGQAGQDLNIREEIRREVAPTASEELDEACHRDQALGHLVDLMGGKPLSETDVEHWDRPQPKKD